MFLSTVRRLVIQRIGGLTVCYLRETSIHLSSLSCFRENCETADKPPSFRIGCRALGTIRAGSAGVNIGPSIGDIYPLERNWIGRELPGCGVCELYSVVLCTLAPIEVGDVTLQSAGDIPFSFSFLGFISVFHSGEHGTNLPSRHHPPFSSWHV